MRVRLGALLSAGVVANLLRPAISHAQPWFVGVVAQAQQPAGGIKAVGTGKNYFWEIAITVVMFGLALYAVCKTSRRQ
ncbi:MAG: hypothetical protein HZA46_00480 [Planctomycetales bacterium]|nr:hypothetical protein [Planctomycetales bacterium]